VIHRRLDDRIVRQLGVRLRVRADVLEARRRLVEPRLDLRLERGVALVVIGERLTDRRIARCRT
jgi:hypothetical protein